VFAAVRWSGDRKRTAQRARADRKRTAASRARGCVTTKAAGESPEIQLVRWAWDVSLWRRTATVIESLSAVSGVACALAEHMVHVLLGTMPRQLRLTFGLLQMSNLS
jgi:hypothetical protein